MSMTVHNEAAVSMAAQVAPTHAKKQVEEKTEAAAPVKEEKVKKEMPAAVYEKSDAQDKKTPYKINRMSAEDRARIVQQMKEADAARQEQLAEIMRRMMNGQKKAHDKAHGFMYADAKSIAQAKADIGEDGYWGVKQTSQRLFDFASALAGDDVEQMHKMQKAMEKGFRLATGAWGKELPGICGATFDRANELFEAYYKAKEEEAAKGAEEEDAGEDAGEGKDIAGTERTKA